MTIPLSEKFDITTTAKRFRISGKAKSIIVRNTGDNKIYINFDYATPFVSDEHWELNPDEALELDVEDIGHTYIEYINAKTGSATSTMKVIWSQMGNLKSL